ncbi:MAG TPA: tyrosine-type recombinase/integrase [Steroidobacteraceae bacterium]|nr:tyrosine-type recombinase/integrase [Steroidobacteraceae bacterium]
MGAKTVTAKTIENAKPQERPYKIGCGNRLLLVVTPEGGKYWRLKYRHNGKERGYSLGTYPAVSLALARQKAAEAAGLLRNGVDPADARREQQAETVAQGDTFKAIAEEWLGQQARKLSAATLSKARWVFNDLIYPSIGDRPIGELTAPELLKLLREIDDKGMHETAQRTRARISQVMRYAIATGRAERDPTQDLRGALTAPKPVHHAAITEPTKVGQLLLDIDAYSGEPSTQAALRLAPLLFVRPGELRAAEWSEIDLDAGEWRIPEERMKMKRRHIVPLSKQAVAILRELHRLTGRGKYVFPALGNSDRPMSENTINNALRRLGYAKTEMTGHGFRTMASTLLNEQDYSPDVIELQLAHLDRNKVRAAYNHSERLPQRRQMMQAYADYLDGLKAAAIAAEKKQRASGAQAAGGSCSKTASQVRAA